MRLNRDDTLSSVQVYAHIKERYLMVEHIIQLQKHTLYNYLCTLQNKTTFAPLLGLILRVVTHF